MIQTTIPEIDVNAFMARVRAETDEIHQVAPQLNLPPIATALAPPRAILPEPVNPKTDALLQAVENARAHNSVSRWIPKFLRGLFRQQGEYNRDLLRAVESLAKTNAQLADRARHLAACVGVQDHWLSHLAETRRLDGVWMKTISDLASQFHDQHQQRFISLQADITRALSFQHRTEAVESGVTVLRAHLHRLQVTFDQLTSVALPAAKQTEDLASEFRAMREEMKSASNEICDLRSALAEVQGTAMSALERVHEGLRNEAGAQELLKARVDALGSLESAFAQLNDTATNTFQTSREALHHEVKARELLEERVNGNHSRLDLCAHTLQAVREALHNEARARELLEERVGGNHSRLDLYAHTLEAVRESLTSDMETRKLLSNQLTQDDRLLHSLHMRLDQLDERESADSAYLRRELYSYQQKLVVSQPPTKARKESVPLSGEINANFDAFYLAFENQFRGSRAEIKQRLSVYLPLVHQAKAGTDEIPIIDLGCGRGEWLQLLRDEKLVARGIDLNQCMVEECLARNLEVVHVDALAFLATLPDDSVSGVTAFHLIEHLPFSVFLRLFNESLRVLKSGGICIFETPNPENVQVGSNRFYSDPTHLRPLPKDYTRFVMTNAGFRRVTILPLHPDSAAFPSDEGERPVDRFVNHMFFGEQDYAVIGYK